MKEQLITEITRKMLPYLDNSQMEQLQEVLNKFRRTLATRAIDKGMPIEQVQRLLGHSKIDTTMQYAMVNQNNVKISHRKYIG